MTIDERHLGIGMDKDSDTRSCDQFQRRGSAHFKKHYSHIKCIDITLLLSSVRLTHLSRPNKHMLRLTLHNPPISLSLPSISIPSNLLRPSQSFSLISNTL